MVGSMLTSTFGWIIAASGVVTAVAGLAAVLAPHLFLRSGFGVESPQSSIVFFVRHWGILIFVVGALLVYSAGVPAVRTPVLTAAAVENCSGLLMFLGSMRRTSVMTAAVIGDGLFAVLYVAYLAEHLRQYETAIEYRDR
jgi:hypothetical protein